MRSYIFSSKSAAPVFIFCFLLGIAGLELYARQIIRYEDPAATTVALILSAPDSNAVFGDSQIGLQSFLPGYSFYGTAGQQPEEFERVARYVVARKHVRRAIVEASPQWFGQYHEARKPLIGSHALPSTTLPFDVYLLSDAFNKRLADSLLAKIRRLLLSAVEALGPKQAHAQQRPSVTEVAAVAAEWQAAIDGGGGGQSYRWSTFPSLMRALLTLSRVVEQNPRENFESSDSAAAFERAIDLLIAANVEVCLYRTPVTTEYENLAARIPDSRYVHFQKFIHNFAEKKGLRQISYTGVKYSFDDSRFINQDHMNAVSLAQVWPLIEGACFPTP